MKRYKITIQWPQNLSISEYVIDAPNVTLAIGKFELKIWDNLGFENIEIIEVKKLFDIGIQI